VTSSRRATRCTRSWFGTAHGGTASEAATELKVESADARVAPIAATAFTSADDELKTLPLRSTPAPGNLIGKGLSVTDLAYTVTNSTRALLSDDSAASSHPHLFRC